MEEMKYGKLVEIYGKLPENTGGELDPVTGAVLYHFGKFCSVPHGSGNEAALAEILEGCFAGRGRRTRIDEGGNLIVDIPASPGCEAAPLLMLQGHIDMVCAVRPGSGYEPERDPISARLRRDAEDGRLVLESMGDSSLGADCGLGDAGILWMFAAEEAGGISVCRERSTEDRDPGSGSLPFVSEPKHGPVRIVLTTREENGLGGALELSPEVFDGVRFIINVDGFDCGRFVAGSAGGRREKYRRPVRTVETGEAFGGDLSRVIAFEICISGFTGGHSGSDIAEGRVNALWMMARFLRSLSGKGVRYALSSFTGGHALNAIPGDAQTIVSVREEDLQDFQNGLLELIETIQREYREKDDRGRVNYYEIPLPDKVFAKTDRDALVDFVSSLTTGVKSYMKDMPDTPETSCNLGVADARVSGEYMDVHIFERSIGGNSHEELMEEHRTLSGKYGFERRYSRTYPAWEYRTDNRLPHMAKEIFEKETGMRGEVRAVHVGLEPAVFYGINPEMQMVCMGADILDPHSIHERVYVDTIRPFAMTLRRLVETIAEIREERKL